MSRVFPRLRMPRLNNLRCRSRDKSTAMPKNSRGLYAFPTHRGAKGSSLREALGGQRLHVPTAMGSPRKTCTANCYSKSTEPRRPQVENSLPPGGPTGVFYRSDHTSGTGKLRRESFIITEFGWLLHIVRWCRNNLRK